MVTFSYLFWSMNGNLENEIFRLDLADISNGVKHEIIPFSVLKSSSLGPFTIDYVNFKLLVPLLNESRIISLDLAGRNIEDVRNNRNTDSIQLEQITSIAMANGLLYWTDGTRLWKEEFHSGNKKYYKNSFAGSQPWLYVRIGNYLAQPVPYPMNPPTNLQALLTVQHGKISWHVPHLLSIQGRGAWQTWSYQLIILDEDRSVNTTVNNISGTHHPIDHLRPNTNYCFKASAYTESGTGPWSTEFRTKTLRSHHDRYLIWSSNGGLQQSDIVGEHFHELMPRLEHQNITNLAWMDDMVYFVSNYTLHYFNRTSASSGIMKKFQSIRVQTVAVDWIGPRLYWLNREEQGVFRAHLDGQEQEALFSLYARDVELQIDSFRGIMYFSTGQSVEYCQLNGRNRNDYYKINNYVSKQVMGLTLDLDNHRVYWIVRSQDSSSLLSAPMVGGKNNLQMHLKYVEYQLKASSIEGPLNYFSDRLIWLQDEHTVIIGNTTGKNLAHIRNSKLSNLHTLAVIDPNHRPVPKIHLNRPVRVIPEPIDIHSIQITGNWSSFVISWSPIVCVNYGQVFYDIRFLNVVETERKITNITYTGLSVPYMAVNISIQAYTYWGKSPVSRVNLNSPAAKPFPPLDPRVFITHRNDPFHGGLSIEATFRWTPTTERNGPNLGYKVFFWRDTETEIFNRTLNSDALEQIFTDLRPNTTYFFDVQAFSQMGNSEPITISVNTSLENSVPIILAVTAEDIIKIDLDRRTTTVLVNTGSTVTHLTHIDYEQRFFWINDNNELITYYNRKKTKLTTIQSPVVQSLTVDWVNRLIFWSQLNNFSNGSSIYSFDLNKFEGEKFTSPSFLSDRPGFVWNLLVSPLDRTLVWVETKTNSTIELGTIFHFSLITNVTNQFYNNEPVRRILTLDTSSSSQTSIIWSNTDGHLFSSPLHQKSRHQLSMLFNAPLGQIVKDSARLYWIRNNDTIVAMNASETAPTYEERVPGILELLAFYHQTYPSELCLTPIKNNNYEISLETSKERSLVFRLPQPKRHNSCSLNLAGTKYTLRYGTIGDDENRARPNPCTDNTCKTVISYDEVKEISDLQPFQAYKFQVGVNNYYTDKLGSSQVHFGPVMVFHTAIGSPSVARNVTVQVLSMSEVMVQWLPPLELNADRVWYEVQWQKQFGLDGIPGELEIYSFCKFHSNNIFLLVTKLFGRNNQLPISINISDLQPNQNYSIFVKASTSGTTFSKTESVHIKTLPEPSNLQLVETKANALILRWTPYKEILKYIITCRDLVSHTSFVIRNSSMLSLNTTPDDITVEGLEPKTRYLFTIDLYFRKSPNQSYIWPTDDRFIFETLADRPSNPGKPVISQVTDAIFKISWEPSKSHGSPIKHYSLEVWDNYTRSLTTMELSEEHIQTPDDIWIERYNGTDNYWIIDATTVRVAHSTFRVRALNELGWGPFSEQNTVMGQSFISPDRKDYLLLAIFIPVAVSVFVVMAGCIILGELT